MDIVRSFWDESTIIGVLFSIISLLWIIEVLDVLQIPVYPTIYRVTFYTVFDAHLLGSTIFDNHMIIALSLVLVLLSVKRGYLTLPFVAGYVIAGIFYSDVIWILALVSLPLTAGLLGVTRKDIWKGVATYAPFSFVVFSAISALVWITLPLFPSQIFSDDNRWVIPRSEAMLYLALGNLSPFISVLLAYSFLLKRYDKYFLRLLIPPKENPQDDRDRSGAHPSIVLLVFMLLGAALPFYPYIHSINPNDQSVGTDVFQYTQHVESLLESRSITEVVTKAFISINGGDRPLTLMLLYIAKITTQLETSTVVEYFPVILTPFTLLTEYMFIRTFTNKIKTIAIVLGFTLFSAQFLAGIYAAFYANWLAVCFTYLTFFFLQRFWKTLNIWFIVFLSFCLILISLSHTYTWSFVVGIFVIFQIITLLQKKKDPNTRSYLLIIYITLAIIASIVFDIGRASLTGSLTGFESDAIVTSDYLDIAKYPERWINLRYTFNTFLGGYLTNTVMMFMALLYILFRSDYSRVHDRILLSSIFIGAIPILFGDYQIQSRIFYNMPIHIIAGLFAANLFCSKLNTRKDAMIFLFLIFHFSSLLFRSMANLIFAPPT